MCTHLRDLYRFWSYVSSYSLGEWHKYDPTALGSTYLYCHYITHCFLSCGPNLFDDMDARPFMLVDLTVREILLELAYAVYDPTKILCRDLRRSYGQTGLYCRYIGCFLSCDCNLFDDRNVRLRSLFCPNGARQHHIHAAFPGQDVCKDPIC